MTGPQRHQHKAAAAVMQAIFNTLIVEEKIKPPLNGEMWSQVTDQPLFAAAGIWQQTAASAGYTMVACDPSELVAPIYPKAKIAILRHDEAKSNSGIAVKAHRPSPPGRGHS